MESTGRTFSVYVEGLLSSRIYPGERLLWEHCAQRVLLVLPYMW
jgi:hypothetical protein